MIGQIQLDAKGSKITGLSLESQTLVVAQKEGTISVYSTFGNLERRLQLKVADSESKSGGD